MNIILRPSSSGSVAANYIAENSQSGLQVISQAESIPEAAQLNVVIRWGCLTPIPEGKIVLNHADALRKAGDKREARRLLAEGGVSVPQTFPELPEEGAPIPETGVILRPKRHTLGKILTLHESWEDAAKMVAARLWNAGDYYLSAYIPKDSEFRVYVVSGRIVGVERKVPLHADDIAWNSARGATFQEISPADWPIDVCREAIKACGVLGLDFAGVDVIQKDAAVYVLEANTSPLLRHCVNNSKVNFVKALDYTIAVSRMEPLSTFETWQEMIHPAVI